MRPTASTRGERAAKAPSITPLAVRMPHKNISAITSMMPEPQTPVTGVAGSKPGSLDHNSQPITLKRGSSVARSIRTRSMAPGAARWPQEICAPSNAGPVGEEQASRRWRLPSTSSAFVPTSTSRRISSDRYGPSDNTMPAASAPTCPAMHGSRYTRAPGLSISPSSFARASCAPSIVRANGAPPSSTGSSPRNRWCITGLATIVTSTISAALSPADWATSCARSLTPSRRQAVSSPAPPAFIMPYETRLIRSSPKRICGFIRPDEASTSPVTRSHTCAASVVEPISIARPCKVSRKPGHNATISVPWRTAAVTFHPPLRSVCCNSGSKAWSIRPAATPHCARRAFCSRRKSLEGSCMSG